MNKKELLEIGLGNKIALVVLWDTQNDQILFEVNIKEKWLTRRGVLSSLSSVYDLFGPVTPFILKGKQII